MKGYKAFFILYIIFIFTRCQTVFKINKPNVNPGEFLTYNWQKKVEYLNDLDSPPYNKSEHIIIEKSLQDQYSNVIYAGLKYIERSKYFKFESLYKKLLEHSSANIRLQSLKLFQIRSSQPETLKIVMSMIGDQDWLVREKAYEMIRSYDIERMQKKYYLVVLRRINEKNPNVLRQILRTLTWYNDSRTLPYLFERSFNCTTDIELIVVLRELSKFKNTKVKRRIRRLSKKHKKFIIREEARNILNSY